jgi:hypothetical protein
MLMPPPPLQFEFTPRRAAPWLLVALVGLCVAIVAVALAWLWPRQQELNRLREEARRVAAEAVPMPAGAASRPMPWQESAEQEGRLFALSLESRLLEIERCTDAKSQVSRVAHDELAASTTLEVTVATPDDLSALLNCLNTGADANHRWRLMGVETAQSTSTTPLAGARKAVIRRN